MANSSTSWTCPYCNRVATITAENVSGGTHSFHLNNKIGHLGLRTWVTVCPNHECREFTIQAWLFRAEYNPSLELTGAPLHTWNLKPQSQARPFPDYIPAPITDDYNEACLIRDLSPKASATLSRRCLQGMIRDFWGISKSRLVDEISALEGTIDATTWAAIDAVRSIGNVGAHMERDINTVVEVDPDEAKMLIQLIEVLLEEWYIRRQERSLHMQMIVAAAQAKKPVKPVE